MAQSWHVNTPWDAVGPGRNSLNVYGVGWGEFGEEKERKTVRVAEIEERRSDKKSDRRRGGGGGGSV